MTRGCGPALIPVLMVFLFAGAGNTLIASWMEKTSAPSAAGGKDESFSHPFVQSWVMFVGEGACGVAFLANYFLFGGKSKLADHQTSRVSLLSAGSNTGTIVPVVKSPLRRQSLMFMVPACFDWFASTMIYIGYNYLPASTVQMLRGSLIFFVCAISVFGLKNKLYAHHFIGVVTVAVGIFLVALSSVMTDDGSDKKTAGSPLMGVAICITSQLFAALIMTSEEFIFRQVEGIPPLLAVGIEGMSGFTIGLILLTIFGLWAPTIENPVAAAYQFTHSWQVALSCFLLACSIAFFNVAGQQITKSVSSMARSALDSSRTILIWVAELSFGWRPFEYASVAFWVQPFGFCFIVTGTMLYFNTIKVEAWMGLEEIEALRAEHAVAQNQTDQEMRQIRQKEQNNMETMQQV